MTVSSKTATYRYPKACDACGVPFRTRRYAGFDDFPTESYQYVDGLILHPLCAEQICPEHAWRLPCQVCQVVELTRIEGLMNP